MHNTMISFGRSRRPSRRRALNFSSIIISSYCSVVPSSLNILIMYATVVAGFAPTKQHHNHIIDHASPTISSRILPYRTIQQRYHTSHSRTPTSLHVSWFDKFHLPYGVNTTTNDNDDVELLEALLPTLPTPEDKRRVMEGFQQARLSEQIRLSKNKKGINEQPKFLADDESTVSRMADLFQQARLSEQLRLSKIKGVYSSEVDEGINIDDDMLSDEEFDKVEMFQRALLEEQLKIRRLQRQKRQKQHRLVVSSSESIEKAMNEYEVEKEMHQMATMVHENETFDEGEIGDGTNGDDIDAASIILSNLSANDIENDGNSKAFEGELLSVNETEPSHQLDIQLAKLHQMIAFATSPPGLDTSVAISQSDTTSNAKVSLQTFLSTTYLPLQPREDAAVLSLALAPAAHLLSSVFLFGAALFYGVMAVLDMIMNDTDTRACLKETGSVMKSSFGYVFPQSGMKKLQEGVAKRTIKAFQISLVAFFYALQGVLVRAARKSKYRIDCGNAATGALRYLVYALRSVKVVWNRVTNKVKRSFQESKVQSKPSLTAANDIVGKHSITARLNRVYSGIKEKFSGQRKGMEYQHDMQPDELYEQKLRQDRIVFERDKLQLQEAQRRLELEQNKLLADGLNVMAWYAAVEDKIGKDDEKKRRWWRRK